jgi:hypothetical protein
MTDEEFLELCQQTYSAVQDENGVDVTQIDRMLSLTATQRLEWLEQYLDEMNALMAGRERLDAEAEVEGTP